MTVADVERELDDGAGEGGSESIEGWEGLSGSCRH